MRSLKIERKPREQSPRQDGAHSARGTRELPSVQPGSARRDRRRRDLLLRLDPPHRRFIRRPMLLLTRQPGSAGVDCGACLSAAWSDAPPMASRAAL